MNALGWDSQVIDTIDISVNAQIIATDIAMLDVPSYVGKDYFCETGVPPGQR